MGGDRQIRQRRSAPCPLQKLASPKRQAVRIDPRQDPEGLTRGGLSTSSRTCSTSLASCSFAKCTMRLHQSGVTMSQVHGGPKLPMYPPAAFICYPTACL